MQYSLNCNVLLNETETLPSLEGGPFSWAWEAVFIPDTEPGPEHGDGPVGPQTETEVSLQLLQSVQITHN